MVDFRRGNLFTSKCQTLVNTVNCEGVMGAGIALEFRYRYPSTYERYRRICADRQLTIGKLWLDSPAGVDDGRKVLCFPTKDRWKQPSRIEYLERGLEKFQATYRQRGIMSVAFPLLGTEKGGLEPGLVRGLMEEHLRDCEIPVDVVEFDPTCEDELFVAFKAAIDGKDAHVVRECLQIGPAAAKAVLGAIETQPDLRTVMGLARISGIGHSTMPKLFRFAQRQTEPRQGDLGF